MARITQSIISTGVVTDSPPLKELLLTYLKKNLNSEKFPKEIKAYLSRIIDLTSLDPKSLQTQIQETIISSAHEETSKNVAWQQIEIYLQNVFEIEGKNITPESKKNIIKYIEENKARQNLAGIAKLLMRYEVKYDNQPELWQSLAESVFLNRTELILKGDYIKSLQYMIEADYFKTAEMFWRFKDTIVENTSKLDMLSLLEMRNLCLLHFPEEIAFITTLEQKSIGALYNFGRSYKTPLFHGMLISKNKRMTDQQLTKVHQRLPSALAGGLDSTSRKARMAMMSIRKMPK